MNIKIELIAGVAALSLVCLLSSCGGKASAGKPLTVSDGERKWTFVPVDGKSTPDIAAKWSVTGTSKAKSAVLSMPCFWIAKELVTEGEFASLMGRKVREGRDPGQPLADIEWEDAFEYCDRFTKRYAGQLPGGVFATLPTQVEWVHAVHVLKHPKWLDQDVGSFLFTRSQDGGFLATPGTFFPKMLSWTTDLGLEPVYDLAESFVRVAKRAKKPYAGLRLVLVDIKGSANYVDGKEFDNSMVSRGVILVQYGYFEQGKQQLIRVLAEGKPSYAQTDRAKEALRFAIQEHEYGYEDWSGLVSQAAKTAETKGFSTQPFVEQWMGLGSEEQMESESVAQAYEKAGIVGEWMRIGDLPEEVRKDQPVGEKQRITAVKGENLADREFTVSLEHRVQVLRCDFTGDGRDDLVVETFGSVGSLGYWYAFYAQEADGTYSHVDEDIQTVGLCALPRKDGGACGFLVLGKVDNPVLDASILTIRDGKTVVEDALDRPVVMIDAAYETGKIYVPAPFIGMGYGLGWSLLQGRGVWYRPLFWPWTPGTVQGLEDAAKDDAP